MIQAHLKKAEHVPKIFSLYANKPVPEASTSAIRYCKPNPKSIKNAVPQELANLALDVAIEQKKKKKKKKIFVSNKKYLPNIFFFSLKQIIK